MSTRRASISNAIMLAFWPIQALTFAMIVAPSPQGNIHELNTTTTPGTARTASGRASQDNPMATTENQKRQRAERTRAFLEQLINHYPDCFTRDRDRIRPLAIGIQQQVRSAVAEQPELQDTPAWLIRQALALYTRSPAYLDATIARRRRINLDGSDADDITDEAVAYATERREEQKQRRAERRKQARKPQKPRKPSAEERKQQKLEALARKFNS